MNRQHIEKASPWIVLLIIVVLWQLTCSMLQISEFIFPSPIRIVDQFLEHKLTIAAHAWRTFWVTMAGFGLAIVVGVLLVRVLRELEELTIRANRISKKTERVVTYVEESVNGVQDISQGIGYIAGIVRRFTGGKHAEHEQ